MTGPQEWLALIDGQVREPCPECPPEACLATNYIQPQPVFVADPSDPWAVEVPREDD